MEPDALAANTPGTGLRAAVFAALSWQPMQAPQPPSALALKVTFLPLDIFLPRYKLRSTVTSGAPGFFED
jgi:hypothetical protein